MAIKPKGWIGVDLDGTLAHYTTWEGTKIGAPIPLMVERVKGWLAKGLVVKVLTARDESEHLNISAWCYNNIGTCLQVTNSKDRYMIALWDDRAVQVKKNTGEVVGGEEPKYEKEW